MDAYCTASSQDSLPQGSSYGFGKELTQKKWKGMDWEKSGVEKWKCQNGHWAVNRFADQSFSWVALMKVIQTSPSCCE